MGIKYRGETFAGYNKPKRTPKGCKKYAVLAKSGNQVRLVRFGAPKMHDYRSHKDAKRRASFKARHRCGDKVSMLTRCAASPVLQAGEDVKPKWWSCNWSW